MMSQLASVFAANVAQGPGQGAAVSIWRTGEEICHLCTGEARRDVVWTKDTLVPIHSATKTASAACLLQALYDRCRGPELEVGDLWPRFPLPHCTVGQLLSHQSGLAALTWPAPLNDLDACRHAIEHSRPEWTPPAHGYHPHTIGPMVDILMLELTGIRLGEWWEQRVRCPLGLDFYIGLPASEHPRVAQLRAARLNGGMPDSAFYTQFVDAGSAVYRAFHSLTGCSSAREMNTPAAWECASPAKGGVASARGLAQFYQALLGYLPNTPFVPEVLEWMASPQCNGYDRTLCCPTSFGCGAMLEPSVLFGRGGLGHAGAGGSHGFAEPSTGCSFAFVMNQMELGVLPGERVRRLIEAFMVDCT